MTQSVYLAPKPHYEILDGLRGVAAFIVVAFHLLEAYADGPIHQALNHGYLAVDFFFVLSGFVIGYAYDNRWGLLSVKDFFKRRLIRLQPMVIMGTLIGTLLFYFGEGSAFPLIGATPWWKLILLFLLGCTMLPALPAWDIRGWKETNTLDAPVWTLMYEYIANILYALFVRHFSRTVLAIFVAGAAFLTLDVTLNLDVFGLLESRSKQAYTMIGGWRLTPTHVYIGMTRLLYPFFMGLLVYRLNKRIKVSGALFYCSLLVTAILVMPRVGGERHLWMNGVYEAFCILVMFPLIIAMGAGSRVTGKRSLAFCRFMGEISYPLYITHYPLIYLQTAWVAAHPDAPLGTNIFLGVSVFLLSLGLAYACLKLYDMPVREWLKKRFLMRHK